MKRRLNNGYTLVELMIVVAIVAIVSAIALPLYNGYIDSSQEGRLLNNIATIEIFQEDFLLRSGGYLTVAANIAAITAGIGWAPRANDGVTYAITDPGGGSYRVTAIDPGGTALCMQYPEKTRC